MFAALVVERPPLVWSDLTVGLVLWLQGAGGFAAVGLLIWFVSYLARQRGLSPAAKHEAKPWNWSGYAFAACFAASVLAYLTASGFMLAFWITGAETTVLPGQSAPQLYLIGRWAFVVGGGLALLAVLVPLLNDLVRWRWRRIWAIAKLSFKEALRRRVLWVFSAFLLIFLFASWFLPSKPEDQLRSYVSTVYFGMAVLLLFTAGLLAAFSIPADIRNQTIHTIVTKPVERFEIVLGRFLGYTLLMTLVLLVMTTLSLSYVVRGVDPDAAEESLKARVPLYGELEVLPAGGVNVGREWEYRKYITGGLRSKEVALWSFRDPPSYQAGQDKVRCEFAFDVFRTTKGQENKGVVCTFRFYTWKYDAGQAVKYNEERRQSADANELARKYGYHQVSSKEITDYHTMFVEVPVGLFENAAEGARPTDPRRPGETAPAVMVEVKCESPTQYVGVAKHDLYFLEADRGFHLNFFKGALGLWMLVCIVIGLAVALSTYLSGVITFLTVFFLVVAGAFQDFLLRPLAYGGPTTGGGPVQSFLSLANRQSTGMATDSSPQTDVAQTTDLAFSWVFRRILEIVPDVDRFDLTNYVAEGFNISAANLFLIGLLVVGYLLPWAILAYYLMKWREVAA